jgi:KUP system potassium uptake protein
VPIAVGVLVALFAIQRHGTGVVGLFFGPVCVAWFAALGTVGAWNIAQAPQILAALDPRHAFAFATAHGVASFIVLGSVLLAITGAEALYADLRPLSGSGRSGSPGWRSGARALPSIISGRRAADRAPGGNREPVLPRVPGVGALPDGRAGDRSTVIASQATISGAFSITQQAMQLGYLPRMAMRHTSASTIGQIYVPGLNWLLLLVVGAAVVGFGSSSRLASAYGVAVMGTMLATTFLTYFVLRYRWRYPAWLAIAATGAFMAVDATFFAAAMQKVLDGGWFPLAVGAAMFIAMTTWRRGRELLLERLRGGSPPLRAFVESLLASPPDRVPGTAVFLISSPDATPNALLHSLKHYKVLHERNVFLHVEFQPVPRVADAKRVECEPLADGCWRVSCATVSPRIPTCRARSNTAAPPAWSSSRWRPPTSCPARRSSRARKRAAWRDGATGCSSRWRGTPAASPTSSGCRRTASWSWERGSASGHGQEPCSLAARLSTIDHLVGALATPAESRFERTRALR